MTSALLWAVALAGPLIFAILVLITATWAVRGLKAPEVRARVRPSVVVPVAAGWLILGAAILDIAGGSFISAVTFSDVGPPDPTSLMAALLPFAIGVGVVLAIGSVIGYLAFARLGPPRRPARGLVVGPVATLVAAVIAAAVFGAGSRAAADAAAGAEQDALVSRSASLHLVVGEVVPTSASVGSGLTAVRLRVTLKPDLTLSLAAAGKLPNPRFVLTDLFGHSYEPGSSGVAITTLPGGTDTAFDLAFDFGSETGAPGTVRLASTNEGGPTAGIWTLRVDIVNQAGQFYTTSTDVTIHSARVPGTRLGAPLQATP